jgi:hypothetical protein
LHVTLKFTFKIEECDIQIEKRKDDKTLHGNFIFSENNKIFLYYTEYKTFQYVKLIMNTILIVI